MNRNDENIIINPSMAINRGQIEDFVNHPRNITGHPFAQGVELPVIPIRINGKAPKYKASYVHGFAIAIYCEDENRFRLSGITTLN